MTPNQVTVTRIGAAFLAVGLFSLGAHMFAVDLAAVILTIAAIALDGVDGYLARRRGLATAFGAKFDILGDRVVENLFFICFAASGLISLWVPVVFFVRGALTDFLSGFAARTGCDRDPQSRWAAIVVLSRASRACYATLKCVCFCYLGLLLSIRDMAASRWFPQTGASWPAFAAETITLATVAFCMVRAIPVLWEGRRLLRKVPNPAAVVLGR